jgi:hypothetical protein
MVNAGECSSNETSGKSEGALMAKHVANAKPAARATQQARRRRKRLPRVYGDPFQTAIGFPAPDLQGESMDEIAFFGLGYFQELAARVKQRCSDKKLSNLEKKVDCFLLIYMVGEATSLVHLLALECELPFREVAEGLNQIPWMFPAHPGKLQRIKNLLWNDFNLGKRFPLKLRPSPGRKTFSFETWVNQFLFDYFLEAHREVVLPNKSFGSRKLRGGLDRIFSPLPLTQKEKAKQWLDVIWELLLIDIPEPEKHPQLRKLGQHPSRVERAHFGERKTTRSIKDAVGENAKHQTDGYIRVAIKEALGKYFVRMLRKEQSDR